MSAVLEKPFSTGALRRQFGARQMVTLSEAEAFLGISHSTMKSLVRTGQIRSVKIGNARRIPVDSLAEVVEHGTGTK